MQEVLDSYTTNKESARSEANKRKAERVAKWEAELELAQNFEFRWGECRRFHSNGNKIARVNWLISKIAEHRAANLCRRCGFPSDSAGHMNGCAE